MDAIRACLTRRTKTSSRITARRCRTALIWALNAAVAKVLLEKGASVDAATKSWTALIWAA